MTRRADPTWRISDTALSMFVRWSRLNAPQIVEDPIVARAVLIAYAFHCPDPEPVEVDA